MQILTFTSLFPDSTRPNFCIFVFQRVWHLAKRGHSVVVISPVPYVPKCVPGQKARMYRAVPKAEDFKGIRVYHPRYFLCPKISGPLHGLSMFIGTYWMARRLRKQFRVDCIDAHFVYPDGLAALLIAKTLRVPLVVSARGTDITVYPQLSLVLPWIKWTMGSAQAIVGVCRALSDAMLALGADQGKVRTIPNGVDTKRFFPRDRSESRRSLGLHETDKVILSVGNLTSNKGHHLVIDAVGKLNAAGISVNLYIAGEGEFRNELEKRIKAYAIADRVILLGSVPNDRLGEWYSAADVSCLASQREGWANVLLESMACGTPVVATRIWGTPEVVTSDRLGLLVERDVDSIANGLKVALENSWDRAHIAGYATARSWDVVGEEVEQLFKDVLSTSES